MPPRHDTEKPITTGVRVLQSKLDRLKEEAESRGIPLWVLLDHAIDRELKIAHEPDEDVDRLMALKRTGADETGLALISQTIALVYERRVRPKASGTRSEGELDRKSLKTHR